MGAGDAVVGFGFGFGVGLWVGGGFTAALVGTAEALVGVAEALVGVAEALVGVAEALVGDGDGDALVGGANVEGVGAGAAELAVLSALTLGTGRPSTRALAASDVGDVGEEEAPMA
ncbi:hypothetical protein [Micromonospora craterilacus]|uniref:hypothetical protein n=1 Tax=Micromonospora craterilacus TaxID=1655439 RepID=UPI001314DF6F|nr:hypothetical protein [Micromonospora craterilacus]